MWFSILKDERFKQKVKEQQYENDFDEHPTKVGPDAETTMYQRKDKSGEYRRTGKAPVWEKFGIAQGLAAETFRREGWKRVNTLKGKGWVMEVQAPETNQGDKYSSQLLIPLKKQKYKKRTSAKTQPRERRVRDIPQGPRQDEDYEKWWKKMKPQERANWRETVVDTNVPQKVVPTGTTEVESLNETYSWDEKDWIVMRQSGFVILDKDWKDISLDTEQPHLCMHPIFMPHDVYGKRVDFPNWVDNYDKVRLTNMNQDYFGTLCIEVESKSATGKPIGDAYAALALAIKPQNINMTFNELGHMTGFEFKEFAHEQIRHKDKYAIMPYENAWDSRKQFPEYYDMLVKVSLVGQGHFRDEDFVKPAEERVWPKFPEKGMYLINGNWEAMDGVGDEEE
tara:strand:- start:1911 stop:3095 length:1185 start_codon:yes stop_codon:yes gene_type:complete